MNRTLASRRNWLLLLLVLGVLGAGVAYKKRRGVKRIISAAKEIPSQIEAIEIRPAMAASGTRAKQPLKVVETIYAGGVQNGWQDYGWATREAKGPGPAKLRFSDWSGWILAKESLKGRFGGLVFKMKAPKSFGEFLEAQVMSEVTESFPGIEVGPAHRADLDDGWSEVFIPIAQLDPHGLGFDRVRLRARKKVADDWVLLDGLALTEASKDAPPPAPYPTRAASGKVLCKAGTNRISPFIYGVAFMDAPKDMKATAYRWGGNRATRYNWELGVTNAGNDWYFKNVSQDPTAGSFVEEVAQRRAVAAITVPMIGWVSKDTTAFSFPASVFGPQKNNEWERPEVGNGEKKDGTKITPGPPTRTSVPAPPEWVAKWVERLRADDKRRGVRTVREYMLDNEPVLWNQTHRDVHPDPLGYDELLDRTIRYGSAVRAADPEAIISGPAEWGWDGYWWSAKDAVAGLKKKPDRLAHGDVPLLAWYLRKLREHQEKTGVRILDVVDVHFYPEGDGVKPPGGTDTNTSALRFRQTRGLWDPTYKDESWIGDTVKLIPRLKELVAQNYPGLGISIGEWSMGAEGHLSGGLAVAEALGRFGQAGITSAYYWVSPKKGMPVYWAFRAYRDFDGAGSRFFDTSVPTSASGGVSVFASKDDGGKRIVAVVINPDPDKSAKTSLDLSECGAVASTKIFSYWGQPAGLAPQTTESPLEATFPPSSISVIDVTLAP